MPEHIPDGFLAFHPDQQMNMVFHQAVQKKLISAGLFEPILQLCELHVILFVIKNLLPVDPTQHHMIGSAGGLFFWKYAALFRYSFSSEDKTHLFINKYTRTDRKSKERRQRTVPCLPGGILPLKSKRKIGYTELVKRKRLQFIN